MTRVYPGSAFVVLVKGSTDGTWDESRMHRVLTNLLVNATKYGDRAGCVSIRLDGNDPETVDLVVHNFGAPIAAAMLPVLFDPMTRGYAAVDASGAPVIGLGLGLFVVRELVAAHGGTVSVTSTAEDGTSFHIRLPRQTQMPAALLVRAIEPPQVALVRSGTPLNRSQAPSETSWMNMGSMPT
jgi:signal transduction histidine kinase